MICPGRLPDSRCRRQSVATRGHIAGICGLRDSHSSPHSRLLAVLVALAMPRLWRHRPVQPSVQRSKPHRPPPTPNRIAAFRGFVPGGLFNVCPQVLSRHPALSRGGQTSNKPKPELPLPDQSLSVSNLALSRPTSTTDHSWLVLLDGFGAAGQLQGRLRY